MARSFTTTGGVLWMLLGLSRAQSSSSGGGQTMRSTVFTVIGVLGGLLFLCIAFLIFVCVYRKRLQRKKQHDLKKQAERLAHDGIFGDLDDGSVKLTTNATRPGYSQLSPSGRLSPYGSYAVSPLLVAEFPESAVASDIALSPAEMPNNQWDPVELSAEQNGKQSAPQRQELPAWPPSEPNSPKTARQRASEYEESPVLPRQYRGYHESPVLPKAYKESPVLPKKYKKEAGSSKDSEPLLSAISSAVR